MSKYARVFAEANALRTAREELKLTLEEIETYFGSSQERQIYGVDKKYLEQIESKQAEVPFGLLTELSKYYDKPTAYFFAKNPKKRRLDLPDRRTTSPFLERKEKLSRDTLIEIKKARGLQVFTREYLPEYLKSSPLERVTLETDISALAQKYRKTFRLEPSKRFSSFKKYFEYLRTEIESLGILVVQAPLPEEDGIRGLSIIDEKPFLILINRRDGFEVSYAPRIFSLLHEFAHILLRDESLCSESHESRGKQETFCNKLASRFLLPRDEFLAALANIKQSHPGFTMLQIVEALRNTFRVGFDSAAWRLKEFGYIKSDDSVEALIVEWRKKQREEYKQFPRQPSVQTTVKSAYGDTFTKRVIAMDRSDTISPVAIAQILNIKMDEFGAVRKAFK